MPNSIDYAKRLRAIRPFITFDYNLREPLSPAAKSKITRYYNAIDKLSARPHQIYRPRTKSHLKAAQNYSHAESLPGLRVAFIPTNGQPAKIRFNKRGELVISQQHVTRRVIEFDMVELVEDANAHIAKILRKEAPRTRFGILAGNFEIRSSFEKPFVAGEVKRLMNKYSNEDANNYYGNWMRGLAAYHFTEQEDIDAYNRAREKSANELARKRKNTRRREKYKRARK